MPIILTHSRHICLLLQCSGKMVLSVICMLHVCMTNSMTTMVDAGRSANKVRHTTAITRPSSQAAFPLTGSESVVPDLGMMMDHYLSPYCVQALLMDPSHLKAPPQPQLHLSPCQRTVLGLVLQLQTQAEAQRCAHQPQKLKLDLLACMLQCYLAQSDHQQRLPGPQP